MNTFHTYFANNKDRFISEWKEFLSYKSISADPAFHQDCLACADWVIQHLKGLGFSTELWQTATKPVVYGMLPGVSSKPAVLFYGHYDVQPVDPLELWQSQPFEPEVREGRMYARGAEDNKGQLFYFLKAIEALKASGCELPTIKVIIEGEEEYGSQALHAGLSGWREELQAEYLMVCDTGMVALGVPTFTMGLRGIAHFELHVHGPAVDLHSGMFGGVVVNPLQALVQIVSALHNEDGSIAVPGFYDGVTEPPAKDRQLANEVPLDLAAIEKSLGVPLVGGERRLPPLERRGFRPTLEINGIGGGYQGVGGKTVIPSYGIVKVSMRLVAGQDPKRVLDGVISYIRSIAPEGVRVEIADESIGGPALLLSTETEVVKRAAQALEKEFGRPSVFMWEGASIPIIPKLSEASGGVPLLVGFGLEEDRIHAPNESFGLEQFEQGYRYVTAFLSSL